jgi:hypothetical protein
MERKPPRRLDRRNQHEGRNFFTALLYSSLYSFFKHAPGVNPGVLSKAQTSSFRKGVSLSRVHKATQRLQSHQKAGRGGNGE